ncbi:amino acid adenylation protein, partial [Dietzia sp. SLG510A3-3B2-2]|nr:amino acid adenylation protein [Dietzia sp. SLG510A3-30A2]MBB1008586.1 amino acid adenylation protein [Dietzia sp. SLG510A3-3B2-2]
AALLAGLALVAWGARGAGSPSEMVLLAALWSVPATLLALALFAAATLGAVRLLSIGLDPGFHPVHSRIAWQAWCSERLMDAARNWLYPLYASMLTPVWLRMLGARIGKDVEASTVLLIPALTTVRDGAFLADDTMVAPYELGSGWMRLEHAQVGKRAFLGNSGIASAGRKVPARGLVAVLSSAPQKAKKGTSWLGSPPQKLPRAVADTDDVRTYQPPRRLKVARAAWETLRLVPVWMSFLLLVSVLVVMQEIHLEWGFGVAALTSGLTLAYAGLVALVVAALAKWILVGRIRAGEQPLWSSFVWRNEVADSFIELLAAPWMARPASGTPVMNAMLRLLGSRIGRGVWCESYWLPEADLITLGDGATINRGCVVQTHLFHDRIMQIDRVTIEAGATLGCHCVALPASSIGDGSTVGPASLVMRGDRIPPGTRWQGNPIAPWRG